MNSFIELLQHIHFDKECFFARIMRNTELVAIPNIPWPLPEEKIVVEFLCLPTELQKYAVIKWKKLIRFDASLQTSRKTSIKKRLFENFYETKNGVFELQVWSKQKFTMLLIRIKQI
jgi:hypothetical protein